MFTGIIIYYFFQFSIINPEFFYYHTGCFIDYEKIISYEFSFQDTFQATNLALVFRSRQYLCQWILWLL